MKIGVYGGSFNPCHLMHKRIVDTLLEKYGFDRIIILPTGNYYRKSNLLKGEERIKLLELMFEDNPKVILCDYEFKNNLICTYRSMDYLSNLYKGDSLYFILGSDNLLNLHTWKKYEYLLNTYNLIVICRKNTDVSDKIEQYSKYKGDFIVLDLDIDDVSSSEIRNYIYIQDIEKAEGLLDKRVLAYILKRGFYQRDYKEQPLEIEMSDEEFLKEYNSDSYEKMSITTDIALFGISDIKRNDYRRINQKAFSILLVKRKTPPFYNKWCIPGGFLSLDEELMDCANRVLFTETNLDKIYLEQLYTFSGLDRDIRGRVLSTAYIGLVDINRIDISKLRNTAKFFNLSIKTEKNEMTIEFISDAERFTCKVESVIDKHGELSFKEISNGYLAFDNLTAIAKAISRLKNKINYTDIVFHMMPPLFTLKELQMVYEAILNKKLLDPVFRRDIKDKVIKTEIIKIDGGHRPSVLYKYKGEIE